MRTSRDLLANAPPALGTFVGNKEVPSVDPFPGEQGKRA